MSNPDQRRQYKCRHCYIVCLTPQLLGGHVRMKHAGMPSIYGVHKILRQKREGDRMAQKIAKEMYLNIQAGTLDDLTSSTFKQKRN